MKKSLLVKWIVLAILLLLPIYGLYLFKDIIFVLFCRKDFLIRAFNIVASYLGLLPINNIKSASSIPLIEELNNDNSVHGILIQLPLPKGLDPRKILQAVSPKKDVDGFHPMNIGYLFEGSRSLEHEGSLRNTRK